MIRKLILTILAAAAPAYAQPQTWAWDDGTVPYVVTPVEIVERMLRMAEVGKDDFVIDLGSGDGRIIIESAKRGARGSASGCASRPWIFSTPTWRKPRW